MIASRSRSNQSLHVCVKPHLPSAKEAASKRRARGLLGRGVGGAWVGLGWVGVRGGGRAHSSGPDSTMAPSALNLAKKCPRPSMRAAVRAAVRAWAGCVAPWSWRDMRRWRGAGCSPCGAPASALGHGDARHGCSRVLGDDTPAVGGGRLRAKSECGCAALPRLLLRVLCARRHGWLAGTSAAATSATASEHIAKEVPDRVVVAGGGGACARRRLGLISCGRRRSGLQSDVEGPSAALGPPG